MLAGTGNADIKQSAFFLHVFIASLNSVVNGQQFFGEAHEENRIPLQALGGVDGGQGDALHRGVVLVLGTAVQLTEYAGKVDALVVLHDLRDEIHQRRERLPALTSLRTLRLRGGQSQLHEGRTRHSHRIIRQIITARGSDEHADGFQDLWAAEEALATADLVDHSGVGKRLFKLLRLRVDTVEDRNLRGLNSLVEQGQNLARDLLGLNLLRFIGLKRGLGPWLAHTLKLQTGSRSAARSL